MGDKSTYTTSSVLSGSSSITSDLVRRKMNGFNNLADNCTYSSPDEEISRERT